MTRPRASTGAPSSACPNVGKGADFRKAYAAKYPDTTFGIVYTGWCYDMVQMLKNAWTDVDPADTKAVVAHIKSHPYDGTTGHIDFSNVEAPVYPDNVDSAGQGRHAPVLPGAGRQAHDRAAG